MRNFAVPDDVAIFTDAVNVSDAVDMLLICLTSALAPVPIVTVDAVEVEPRIADQTAFE